MSLIPRFIHRRIAHRPNFIKIVDNFGWLLFDKIMRIGVGLFVGVWVARYLGPEQFGLLSFASAFIGLFAGISGLGLQGIVVRNIVREPDCKEGTLVTAALLQFIGGLLTYGLILFAIFWLRPEDSMAKILVAILGSSSLFRASDVAVYWFESQVQSKYTVWVQNGVFFIFAVIKVVLILSQAQLVVFAWVTMAEAFTTAMLMSLVLRLRGPRFQLLWATWVKAKALLKDSWPLMISSMAVMFYMKIDQIMLGQMVGDEAVGIYSAALRISEAWYFIPMVIVASVFPAILQTKQNNKIFYFRLQALFDLMSLMSITIAASITLLSPYIIDGLFGVEYSQASTVLIIHIWSTVFVFLGVVSGKWFIAENLQHLILFRAITNCFLNIALNYLLIPLYGAIGAAIALLITQSTGTFVYDIFRKDTRRLFYMKMSSFNLYRIIRYRSWLKV